jgi:ceramide glucosyltransferase
VRAIQAAFSDREVVVNVGAPAVVANPKVANLLAMAERARHDIWVLADSDVRVDADYLRAVTAPLRRPSVGVVTCVYAAEPRGGWPAHLGAAFVNEQFAPSVLVASSLGSQRHTYGATIAVRRRVLDAAGGLRALGAHLADDHALGRNVAALGYRIVLARYVPRTISAEATFAALWRHELRWHRTIRALAPAGYAGIGLTYPVPLALIAAALAERRSLRFALLGVALAARAALRRATARAFGVAPTTPAVGALRDALGFAMWLRGFGSGRLEWRGAQLALSRGDELA